MAWRVAGVTVVLGWLVAEQTPTTVNAQVTLENWTCITTPRKAIYGQFSAASLVALVEQHGKALFERNIRHYLGSYGVNTAIETSVRRAPADFFYLNNGVTAVARTITPAAGLPERCSFGFTEFSIVNGAQTAGAIANAAARGEISPDAKVLITIIEIGEGADDIGLRLRGRAITKTSFAASTSRRWTLSRSGCDRSWHAPASLTTIIRPLKHGHGAMTLSRWKRPRWLSRV